MMIFPSKLLPTGRFRCSYAVLPDVKLFPVTFSITIPVCSNVQHESARNLVEDHLRLCLLSKRKPVTFPLIFQQTLFPLPTVRFIWSQAYSSPVFVRQLTSVCRFPASVAPHK